MQRQSTLAVLVNVAFAITLFGAGGLAGAQAQTRPTAEPVKAGATNDLQRSFEIYNYNVAATSGAQRGPTTRARPAIRRWPRSSSWSTCRRPAPCRRQGRSLSGATPSSRMSRLLSGRTGWSPWSAPGASARRD